MAGCFDFAITLHTPYKLCDYKPAYGEIFAPELSGYDFWGYGDMDLVFGDLRAYFTEDKLRKYDKFYACPSTATRRRIMPFTANR